MIIINYKIIKNYKIKLITIKYKKINTIKKLNIN